MTSILSKQSYCVKMRPLAPSLTLQENPEEKQTLRYFETFSSNIPPKPLLQETISRYEISQGQRRS